ncbi:unnamed protein product [Blepharisma stoltei]|uniref:Uncharacterized protein n=1 Tax=Blepharisma stoltei TaxID=1481888 RepID=A0AAU9JL31_9CILI|nr:unnamed protein product [Blepharisma stoltei]
MQNLVRAFFRGLLTSLQGSITTHFSKQQHDPMSLHLSSLRRQFNRHSLFYLLHLYNLPLKFHSAVSPAMTYSPVSTSTKYPVLLIFPMTLVLHQEGDTPGSRCFAKSLTSSSSASKSTWIKKPYGDGNSSTKKWKK